jgi:hypothetical protein
MNKNDVIMIVPNTKNGLAAIKYLSKQITENNILIKLVTKKQFDILIKEK